MEEIHEEKFFRTLSAIIILSMVRYPLLIPGPTMLCDVVTVDSQSSRSINYRIIRENPKFFTT